MEGTAGQFWCLCIAAAAAALAWPQTQELLLATAAGRCNNFHVLGSPP